MRQSDSCHAYPVSVRVPIFSSSGDQCRDLKPTYSSDPTSKRRHDAAIYVLVALGIVQAYDDPSSGVFLVQTHES